MNIIYFSVERALQRALWDVAREGALLRAFGHVFLSGVGIGAWRPYVATGNLLCALHRSAVIDI